MKKMALLLSILLVFIAMVPTYAQANLVEPTGFDDDTIYYSNYAHYQSHNSFPRTIRVSETRSKLVYSGTLTFTGEYHCYESNCVGYYSGTLYYARPAKWNMGCIAPQL